MHLEIIIPYKSLTDFHNNIIDKILRPCQIDAYL